MDRPPGLGFPFLDVLSGTMGAVVVLVVIFSIIKHPVPVRQVDEFIFVQVTFAFGSDENKKAEKLGGLLIHAPDGQIYAVLPGDLFGEGHALQLLQCWWGRVCDDKYVLFCEVPTPLKGRWIFEPYIVDALGTKTNATVDEFSIWTKAGRLTPLQSTTTNKDNYEIEQQPGALLKAEDVHRLKAIVEIR